MKDLRILLFLMVTTLVAGFVPAQAADHEKEEKIILCLKNHRFKKLRKQFNSHLKRELSALKIKKIWLELEKQFGEYSSHESPRDVATDYGTKSFTLITFEKGSLDMETSFDENGLLQGIFLRPKAYRPPEYAKNLVYNKEVITLKSGSLQLPGEVIYPKNLAVKVPLVILVHGSGPNDLYETIGPCEVFKDIALGLAGRGIACLLYDKRTKVYEAYYDTAQFTLWEETVEDAVNAFYLAKTLKDVDSSRIFILGHSQGGYALPEILKHCPGVRGGISLAGCSRPLDVVLEDQYHYLTALDGKVSLVEKLFLRKEMKKIRYVRNTDLSKVKPRTNLLVYWPTRFWKEIKSYKPVETLKALDVPVLFLQGERDYQVTDKDFSLWKTAYLEKVNWSFIGYPLLNHLFIEGSGKPNPAEYWKGGNIPSYVIGDLSTWILSR